MVIEGAKDEPPRARCCKICVRKLIMQTKFELLFGGGPDVESHNDKDEQLKMKFDDLKLKFESVNDKKKTISQIQKKVECLDREHIKSQVDFEMAILFQQEKLGEE